MGTPGTAWALSMDFEFAGWGVRGDLADPGYSSSTETAHPFYALLINSISFSNLAIPFL